MYYCNLGAIFICQKPDLKSIDEKWAAPAMLSKASWMWGRAYESFLIHVLKHLKLTQKQRVPSFVLTSTTMLHHGDWLGRISPASSTSWSDVRTSSNKGGGMHLNCSLKGSLLSMHISCSMALVQPNSLLSNANMS